MPAQILPAESRTLVENVRWETYVALADDRRGSVPRITYDRGLMELMSPRKEHEKVKTLLGRLIVAFAEAREIDIESVASTTFRRQDINRGFEADEAFYFECADQIREKEEIDLTIDPPPDLVVEIELTAPAIRKLPLLAKFGVPEVWRHDGQILQLSRLCGDEYRLSTESQVLAGFPVAEAEAILKLRRQEQEIKLLKRFRTHVSTRV